MQAIMVMYDPLNHAMHVQPGPLSVAVSPAITDSRRGTGLFFEAQPLFAVADLFGNPAGCPAGTPCFDIPKRYVWGAQQPAIPALYATRAVSEQL